MLALLVALIVLPVVVAPASAQAQADPPADGWPTTNPVDRSDLRVRDPFIVVDADTGYSYLVSSGPGFPMYRSTDLEHWYGPKRVFTPPADFWGTNRSWAPEIHRWQGRWYLLGSFATSDNGNLPTSSTVGTTVLVADAIDGPYTPVQNRPITPPDEFALDATLFVDPAGDPWIVYAKEWLDPRIQNLGRMAAIRVTPDLTGRIGPEVELFTADAPPWSIGLPLGRVVDGPWLYRTDTGELLMLWSGTGKQAQYVTGIARSTTGLVTGPWEQQCLPLFDRDGGHPMIFRDADGELRVTFHAPNSGAERAVIARLVDDGDTVRIADSSVAAPDPTSCGSSNPTEGEPTASPSAPIPAPTAPSVTAPPVTVAPPATAPPVTTAPGTAAPTIPPVTATPPGTPATSMATLMTGPPTAPAPPGPPTTVPAASVLAAGATSDPLPGPQQPAGTSARPDGATARARPAEAVPGSPRLTG